jgi:NAD(P)-dependent dehydrogenase (short-subunit alcohol dehydrogenase family)
MAQVGTCDTGSAAKVNVVMNQPDAKTVFLVSGGAKGITSLCVKKLAARFQSKFILIGRSPNTPEPDWAIGVRDESELIQQAIHHFKLTGETVTPKRVQQFVREVTSGREIRSTLDTIYAAGGEARYISIDVTDKDALHHAIKEAESELGPVTGCIHGAGVIADKLIQQKTLQDIDRVIGVKLQGLINILEVVPADTLSFLVLFSSVAGFYGNAGQSDYAVANEILNKIAHQIHYRHPQCRVMALDWGPWDGGMVTPELKAILTERSVPVIPVDTGTDILVDALTSDSPAAQVVVGGEMIPHKAVLDAVPHTYRLRRRLTLEGNPFLRDHVIGGRAVLPTVCAVAWVVNACEQLYPGYSFYCVDDYRVLKGIVFDDTLADFYLLDLEEISKTEQDGIVINGLISSETTTSKPRFHYKMQVTIKSETPQVPRYPSFDLIVNNAKDGGSLYSDNTLFHGPSFRGIQRVINLTSKKLTMLCVPPIVSLADQGQFQVQTFNPFVTDVQLQSLLIWAKHSYGYGGLPLRIDSGIQYRPIPAGEPTYATLEVKTATQRRLVADVIVHDSEGMVYSKVTGAEITLSERLNTLFQQNHLF